MVMIMAQQKQNSCLSSPGITGNKHEQLYKKKSMVNADID